MRDFIDLLQRHRLLDSPQLEDAAGPLASRFPSPKNLAGELIRLGWLTPYQVNQIFPGRANQLQLESYVLMERLGEGGMGQVFKARNWKLNKLVAVKLIRKERLGNAEIIRRFQREVRAAAQLNHLNVVHAYDCGQCDDRYFYVMEYVDGIDLAQLVRRDGPLSVEQACECIRQAAVGLQHAFERGLVHRDIKPHNLLLARSSDGQYIVKILDMGLARLDRGEDSLNSGTMTREGMVMGTVDYIAPEQARDAHLADTRADLYSLGCTLYFLLTGQPIFPGGTVTEKLLKHQIEPPPSIQVKRPDVPTLLAAILQRLLAKQPEQRYQTPAETATALTAVLNGAAIPSANIVGWADGGGPPAGRGGPPPLAHPAPDGDGLFLPPEEEGQALEDTIATWSSIIETPAGKPASPPRDRHVAQRQQMLWWIMGGGVVLLIALVMLLILL